MEGIALLCLLGAFLAYIAQRSRAGVRKDRDDEFVAAGLAHYQKQMNSPGTFKVFGVDRISKQDAVSLIEASSADNAKVKAELVGIVVTRVERA